MESTIFRKITLLRKISIIATIVASVLFFGLVSTLEVIEMNPDTKVSDHPEHDSPIMPVLLALLFIMPVSASGILASFSKIVKTQILIWVVSTTLIWIAITLVGLWLLIDPVYFDLPANYWNTSQESNPLIFCTNMFLLFLSCHSDDNWDKNSYQQRH